MPLVARELCEFAASVLDGLEHPRFPADHVLSVLRAHLDAPGAVLQRTSWRSGSTDLVAAGYDDAAVAVALHATRTMRHEHPLMLANSRGDLAPATAQEVAGGWSAWHHSPARGVLVDMHGWDQQVSVALRGGPDEVCALAFARPHRDFGEADLALLRSVQPLLQAVDRHVTRMNRWAAQVGSPGAVARVQAAGLTARELAVLVLLAQGLTATATAHRLGCSPHTVHKHTTNLYRKLGARDRVTAVLEAQRQGLIGTGAVHAGLAQ